MKIGYRNKFRSKFEHNLSKVLHGCDYEDKERVVQYSTMAKYNPDFTFNGKPWLLIEAKGRFIGGSKEAAKYVWVKRCHPELEIIFIFSNIDSKAYPGCRRRKDGSFLSMGEWASKNNFLCFCSKSLPAWLVEGDIDKGWYRDKLNLQRATYGMKPLTTKIRYSLKERLNVDDMG